ncbi:MAG: hypothetical protein LC104_17805 [Bacteroidales bacterium]|nr:hypothetical protein [Bacteroidales bacterium]
MIEILLFKLIMCFVVVFGIPMVIVAACLAKHRQKVLEDSKQRQEENRSTSASGPSSATPGVVLSQDGGRVIAMEAPDVQPVTQVAATPHKQGLHPLASFALKVLGRLAVGVVMGQINHPHHKK